MFAARTVRPALATASHLTQQKAGMATLREIEMRLKSVRNIEKITKSMKMIASTKLARAQRAMAAAKTYGEANAEVFKNAEAPQDKKILYVVISSDSGLCGGVHSSVSRTVRAAIKAQGDSPVIIIGDKSKAQLSRAIPKNIALTFNQIGKAVPTFADASAVADLIIKSGVEYDAVHLIYNKFLSVIAYEARTIEIFNEQSFNSSPNFNAYEMEDDATKDLAEFGLANAIYATLVEGHAAEISSRRNAMDNASKNAGEMITLLQMKYNRGRQAVITNELIDIITGASAL